MSNISNVEPQRGNNKKRKINEMLSITDKKDVEIITKKILKIDLNAKKRKTNEELIQTVNKYRKLERCSGLPKEIEYICHKHDHNKDNCSLYDCSGQREKIIEEDLRKYYIY